VIDFPSDPFALLEAVERLEWAITAELDAWNTRDDDQPEGSAALAAVLDPAHEAALATILSARGWQPPATLRSPTTTQTCDSLNRSHGKHWSLTESE
jgi:hypothetical protein